MKLIRFLFSICLVCGSISPVTRAQDEPRAAWQVTSFDITVPNLGGERALNARATLSLRNIGRGAGSTLSLRINSKAEIKSVTIGPATATYQSRPETRGNAQRITISLPAPVPSNQNITATVEYRLPVDENNGIAALSPVGSQFLPQSMWYPQVNNEFAVRGADARKILQAKLERIIGMDFNERFGRVLAEPRAQAGACHAVPLVAHAAGVEHEREFI